MVNWDRTNHEIAKELGLTAAAVSCLRHKLGKPRAPRIGAMNFDNVDWTKQDTIIAQELGISREWARQVRAALGKPKSINHHKPTKVFWTPERIKLLGTHTDEAIAKRLKRDESAVYSQRKKLGIPAVPKVSKRAIKWRPEILAVLGKESDACIAERFGITTRSINRKRRELGIPGKTERKGSYQHWKSNS
jgi:hypothetical protein